MENPYSLANKRILVVGGTSGIGKTTAEIACGLGAEISVIGRSLAKIESLKKEFPQPERLSVLRLDINDTMQVADTLAEITDPFDGVVFCVGTLNSNSIKRMKRCHLDDVFETNFFGVVNFVGTMVNAGKIKAGGSIVFVTSIAADEIAEPGMGAYGPSKAALGSFAKVLAMELSKRRIRVNTVKPGMIKTDFLDKFGLRQSDFDRDERRYPFGYGEPEDVAYAITYFLSDATKWVTGTEIVVDGGRTLR